MNADIFKEAPYQKTENFFVQKVKITATSVPRFKFFQNLCAGKTVLHVGCADAMCYEKSINLHVHLKECCKELVGLDPCIEDLKKLEAECPGRYYSTFTEVPSQEHFDLVIVPEVLEHVLNAKQFLIDVFTVNTSHVLITVPDVIHYCKFFSTEGDTVEETVHPDHKYWFSPYTLYSIVDNSLCDHPLWAAANRSTSMFWLENKSMVAIDLKKA